MKNLLRSIVLFLLFLPFIGCDIESVDSMNSDQTRDAALSSEAGPCDNFQAYVKFVNSGDLTTNFTVYDSNNDVITTENLLSNNSSDIKSMESNVKVHIMVRNPEFAFKKTISLKTCLLYTIQIDENNEFSTQYSPQF